MTIFKPSRRTFLASATAVGASPLLGSLATLAQAQGKTRLNARMDQDIGVLDPGYMVGGVEIDLQQAVMPALIEYNYTNGQLGWRPTAYVSEIGNRDPTHIDFTLNPGFQWTNGFGELTAEDVKYSYERMKTTDWSGFYDQMVEVTLKDRYSGTLVLSEPFEPFWLISLGAGTGVIISQKATEAAGGKFTTEIPATCGPYLYEWKPKQRVVFTPNPEWTGPKPYFEEIHFILVEENNAAELAFEAGELDVTEISSATHARYLTNPPPDSKIRVAGALQYMWMGMNAEHPKLKDIRVRKAIQHAVDVDSIIHGAYSNTVEKSYGIVCPGLIGKRNVSKYEYNPEKARAMLSEAGVSGLELDLKTLNQQERQLAAQIIQANLQEVGITAKVIPLDSGPFWDMGQEAKGDEWRDLQLWIMRYGTNPDPYEACQWFRREQIGVWNWERWSDDEFEDLYQKALGEVDTAKRNAMYVRMQEIMEDTGAYVWISHEPETYVHRANIEIDVSPAANVNFRGFKAV